MTLFASRVEQGGSRPAIKVQFTYGPAAVQLTEDEAHVGAFWAELGRLLAENPEHREAHARKAYERYAKHAAGVSVHGEPLPLWEEQQEEVREHWRHAISG